MTLSELVGKPEIQKWGLAASLVLVATRLTNASIWWSGFVTKTPFNDWGWFPEWVAKEAEYARIPAYKWFLERVVIPNIDLFGWLQFLTEGFLALMLLVGLFSGAVGILATLWAFNIALGSYPVPGEPFYVLQLFVIVPLVIAATKPGRILGLDAWLRPRFEASSVPLLQKLARWAM